MTAVRDEFGMVSYAARNIEIIHLSFAGLCISGVPDISIPRMLPQP